MRLNILSQIIDAYHDFQSNDFDDYRNDFDTSNTEVEDPLGGYDGITDYDVNNLDPDTE
ncbi:MAG: hypothetical protein H6695_06140 [Deferribacteres bacterium]|nr:hypothetical protein [candidate division KSB1 bacterium]MCB9509742.1 hypothetical protein [Deferribacteres bacterium]